MSWLSDKTRQLLPALPVNDLLRDADLPPPVDVDPDQLVRRAGHDAGAAADRRRAAARDARRRWAC